MSNTRENEFAIFKAEIVNELELERKRVLDKYPMTNTKNLSTDSEMMKKAKQKVNGLDIAINTISHKDSDIFDVFNAVLLAKTNSKVTGKYFGAVTIYLNRKFGIFKSDGEKNLDRVLNKVKAAEDYYKHTKPGNRA